MFWDCQNGESWDLLDPRHISESYISNLSENIIQIMAKIYQLIGTYEM